MNSEKPHLVLANNTKAYFNEVTYKTFLNRMTVMYGVTESGKTHATKYILQLLSRYIPSILVICPTNGNHGLYTNYCPVIITRFDPAVIDKIYYTQEQRKELYMASVNLQNLSDLCDLVPSENIKKILTRMEMNLDFQISKVNESKDNFVRKTALIEEYKRKHKESYTAVLKGYLKNEQVKNRIMELYPEIPAHLKACFEYLDTNMHTCLILDDCAADMSSIKQGTALYDTFNKLFFQGRHIFLTTLILTQSIACMPPAFRANAHVNIFLDPGLASAWIELKEVGITSKDKKDIKNFLIPKVFEDKEKYYKIIRDKSENPEFQVFLAKSSAGDETKPSKIGSKHLWGLIEGIPNNDQATLKQNPFIGKIMGSRR